MVIKNDADIREDYVEEEGIKNVLRRILIGPEDGSDSKILSISHLNFYASS